jgi:hypothetical protein
VAVTGGVSVGDAVFLSLVRTWPSTATNASYGDYHYAGMGCDATVISVWASPPPAAGTHDGSGATINDEGTIDSDGGSVVSSVAPTGRRPRVGGDPLHGRPGTGRRLPGGRGRDHGKRQPAEVRLRARRHDRLNATLTGTYRVVGLAYDFTTPVRRSMTARWWPQGGRGTVQ